MGEAKRKKERLGEWYGRPVALGHPDWKEPAKPVVRSIRDRDRLRGESTTRLTPTDGPPVEQSERQAKNESGEYRPARPTMNPRRATPLAVALLMSALAFSPYPEPAPIERKR